VTKKVVKATIATSIILWLVLCATLSGHSSVKESAHWDGILRLTDAGGHART